jgi:hypothetical protein
VSWYLRSTSDRDTHQADGIRRDGTVAALCGAVFAPRLLPFGNVAARSLSGPRPDLP